jgi:hypothetical protein
MRYCYLEVGCRCRIVPRVTEVLYPYPMKLIKCLLVFVNSTHAQNSPKYCFHLNSSAPLPAGLVAHVESVIKKPRADEEKSDFAVKIPREAEAAAVVLLLIGR